MYPHVGTQPTMYCWMVEPASDSQICDDIRIHLVLYIDWHWLTITNSNKYSPHLVGGSKDVLCFHILGMMWSHVTFIFFRRVAEITNHGGYPKASPWVSVYCLGWELGGNLHVFAKWKVPFFQEPPQFLACGFTSTFHWHLFKYYIGIYICIYTSVSI